MRLFKRNSFNKMFQVSASTRPSPCPFSPPLVCPPVWTGVLGLSPVEPKYLSKHCRVLALFGDTNPNNTVDFCFFRFMFSLSPFFAIMPRFLISHLLRLQICKEPGVELGVQELAFRRLRLNEQPETADTTFTSQGINFSLVSQSTGPCWSSSRQHKGWERKKQNQLVMLINQWYIRALLLRFLQVNRLIVAVGRVSRKWLKSTQQLRLGTRKTNQGSRRFKFEYEFLQFLRFSRAVSGAKRPGGGAPERKAVCTPQPLRRSSVLKHAAVCPSARAPVRAEKEPARRLMLCFSTTFFYLCGCFDLSQSNKRD